jgi:hypothetical protein
VETGEWFILGVAVVAALLLALAFVRWTERERARGDSPSSKVSVMTWI